MKKPRGPSGRAVSSCYTLPIMQKTIVALSSFAYRHIAKPIFFRFDAEDVHDSITSLGRLIGRMSLFVWLGKKIFLVQDTALSQEIAGMHFDNPIGLAAGFDYEAKVTRVLPAVGFGWSSVGTLSNQPYEGNERPRLGRLIKSRSLLVNKGFKNQGVRATLARLGTEPFTNPVGISIGVTNTATLATQEAAIADIVAAFTTAEQSAVPFNYYELNISCPNLHTPISFYAPESFDALLAAVTAKKLSKPLFIKMPIDRTDAEALALLAVVAKHPVAGVIFGNLQKDRTDPSFDPEEIKHATKGNFSGKPTEKRSNELIALAYKNYHEQLVIIGCGGVFTAEDAYKKIQLGASLVQMVSGLIYEGPQVVAAINLGLARLLARDGFASISEAVGKGT